MVGAGLAPALALSPRLWGTPRTPPRALQAPCNPLLTFVDEQARHDGLSCTGVVGEQVAQELFAEHRFIDGGNLMRQ
jgi:hypothetical protein